MAEVLVRLFEFLAIVWLARFVLRNVLGGGKRGDQRASQFDSPAAGSRSTRQAAEPQVIKGGEMKKDPQCGTYVSTELSLKTKSAGEVLHFCSRECQEQYLAAHSTRPA
jgi:YHS domain-containing protein